MKTNLGKPERVETVQRKARWLDRMVRQSLGILKRPLAVILGCNLIMWLNVGPLEAAVRHPCSIESRAPALGNIVQYAGRLIRNGGDGTLVHLENLSTRELLPVNTLKLLQVSTKESAKGTAPIIAIVGRHEPVADKSAKQGRENHFHYGHLFWFLYGFCMVVVMHALSSNSGTQRPSTPDGSLATETRKPGSLK
jgi:hypothetical protein